MTYAGQMDCYEHCNDILKKFLDIEVSAAQVFRVTNTYGEQIGKQAVVERSLPLLKDEVFYAEADGSMILTREEGWKEVKAGRCFKSSDCLQVNGETGWIKQSQYVAHLGNSEAFIEKMEAQIDAYGRLDDRLVFICDGATWMRNWISDRYPKAVQVLDYYHASQHLHEFCNNYFDDEKQAGQYAQRQKKKLLKSRVEEVIAQLEALPVKNRALCEQKQNLIQYYRNNKDRMDYKRYQHIGCGIIGSGAIESAHRTVVQKRLKLSGQRWGKTGAQNVLNLRTTEMSGKWNKVIQLVKSDFKKAA
jgi:hypothetical protein